MGPDADDSQRLVLSASFCVPFYVPVLILS